MREQLTENNNYFVIEVLTACDRSTISYRVNDDTSTPAIYDASLFEIISNKMDYYQIYCARQSVMLTILDIDDYKNWKKDVNGFFLAYFDGDSDAECKLSELLNEIKKNGEY